MRLGDDSKRTAAALLLGLAAFVLVAWGIGEAWVSAFGSSETPLMRSLAAGRSHALVEVARAVTWAGSMLVLVPLAAVCCLLLVRARRARDAVVVAVGLGGGYLIANLAKMLTGRGRPPVEHLQHVTGPSFPSGHATQAAAFWTSLLLAALAGGATRSQTWLASAAVAFVVAVVGWSRLYLGVHYPSDVLAGAALGAGWALFARWALRADRRRQDAPG